MVLFMAARKGSDAADSPELRSQRRNANAHTQRGSWMLQQSVQTDGWIGAITAVADGEVIDGSLRLEDAVPLMSEPPTIVRTKGDRPVVIIREDIPNTDDPRAKRLSVAANRVAEASLNWETEVLEDWDAEVGLGDYWFEEELAELVESSRPTQAGEANPKAAEKRIDKKASTVKAAIYAENVELFERAIAATGKKNRGEALIEICEEYLRGRGKAEGQFDLYTQAGTEEVGTW